MVRKYWGLVSGVGGVEAADGFGRSFEGNSIVLASESDVRREKEGLRTAFGRWCHFLG